jgi:hypothetical protein
MSTNIPNVTENKVVGGMVVGILVALHLFDVICPLSVESEWFESSPDKTNSGEEFREQDWGTSARAAHVIDLRQAKVKPR